MPTIPPPPPGFVPIQSGAIPPSPNGYVPSVQPTNGASIGPRPDHPVANWFEDLQNDIKHGTDLTLPGKAMKAIGYQGSDTGPQGSEMLGQAAAGIPLGAAELGHAFSPSGRPLIQHVNEAFRGIGHGLAPVAAVAAPEAFVPGLAIGAPVQSGTRKAATMLGASPDQAELAGNIAAASLPFAHSAAPKFGSFLENNASAIGKGIGFGGAASEIFKRDPSTNNLARAMIIGGPGTQLAEAGTRALGRSLRAVGDLSRDDFQGRSGNINGPEENWYNLVGVKNRTPPSPLQLTAGERGPLITPPPADNLSGSIMPAAAQLVRGKGGRMTKQFLTSPDEGQGLQYGAKPPNVQSDFGEPQAPPPVQPQYLRELINNQSDADAATLPPMSPEAEAASSQAQTQSRIFPPEHPYSRESIMARDPATLGREGPDNRPPLIQGSADGERFLFPPDHPYSYFSIMDRDPDILIDNSTRKGKPLTNGDESDNMNTSPEFRDRQDKIMDKDLQQRNAANLESGYWQARRLSQSGENPDALLPWAQHPYGKMNVSVSGGAPDEPPQLINNNISSSESQVAEAAAKSNTSQQPAIAQPTAPRTLSRRGLLGLGRIGEETTPVPITSNEPTITSNQLATSEEPITSNEPAVPEQPAESTIADKAKNLSRRGFIKFGGLAAGGGLLATQVPDLISKLSTEEAAIPATEDIAEAFASKPWLSDIMQQASPYINHLFSEMSEPVEEELEKMGFSPEKMIDGKITSESLTKASEFFHQIMEEYERLEYGGEVPEVQKLSEEEREEVEELWEKLELGTDDSVDANSHAPQQALELFEKLVNAPTKEAAEEILKNDENVKLLEEDLRELEEIKGIETDPEAKRWAKNFLTNPINYLDILPK